MDLLGDLGASDQLTSARSENAVLKKKVEELSARVKVLTVENESLKAEVEIYRAEAALPNFSNLALGQADSSAMDDEGDANDADHFVQSGNGIFSKINEISLPNIHGAANPLCCVLSPDDVVVATGGANGSVGLCPWGACYSPNATPESVVANSCCFLDAGAPVISIAFAGASSSLRGVFAVGCMDGSVHVGHYKSTPGGRIEAMLTPTPKANHHRKYVRSVAWSPDKPLLASCSADGSIQVFEVEAGGMDAVEIEVKPQTSFHLEGAVEAMVFSRDHLICYNRGTPYLSYFDLATDNFKQSKVNLNAGEAGTANYSDHVSYTIMDLAIYDNKYLAAATDSSRNIILELATGKQIRNLYGHTNDSYSQPKIAWSSNGAYLYGNTQHEPKLMVWDIASSQLVETIAGHEQPIRSIHSSSIDNVVVTTSFDKNVKLWFAPQSSS